MYNSINSLLCWADRDLTDVPCFASPSIVGDCPGGFECNHRGNEAHQCNRRISTTLGLCEPHYVGLVGKASYDPRN